MRAEHSVRARRIALGIAGALLLQALSYGQQIVPPAPAPETAADSLPDSPGTLAARLNQTEPPKESTESAPVQNSQVPEQSDKPTQPDTGTSNSQASPPAQSQQQAPHEPLGTAAAESIPTAGVGASRPAGAAVAPAKQRRVRSILIKVGALVGIGVAVGTTVALSQGSPSRPPGSN